jgi:hypothetical protein
VARDFSDVSSGSPSTASTGERPHRQAGDNLSIAKQFYGDPAKWKKIHAKRQDSEPRSDPSGSGSSPFQTHNEETCQDKNEPRWCLTSALAMLRRARGMQQENDDR